MSLYPHNDYVMLESELDEYSMYHAIIKTLSNPVPAHPMIKKWDNFDTVSRCGTWLQQLHSTALCCAR